MSAPPTTSSNARFWLTATALAGMMVLTRFKLIGDWLHVYDASLAVMFLGGLLLRRHAALAGFVALAVAIDVFAITLRGERFFDSHCVTPTYGVLLLSYAVLWQAGRLYAPRLSLSVAGLGGTLAVAFVAASVAFLMSNGAFYWFGGRYAQPHMAEYLARVWQWGPSYVSVALQYVALGLAAWAASVALPAGRAARSA